MSRWTWTLLLLWPLLWACTAGAPSYPDEPRIEYRRISSAEVQSGASDSLWITIYFEDGDGDLGSAEFTPCVNTCDVAGCLDSTGIDVFITDSRNECFATVLQLPNLTQDNRIDDISGEIDLKVTGVNCRCIGCTRDTVIYDVQIRDRAGNFSNEVTTEAVVIEC